MGNAYPGYGGRVLPLKEEICADVLARQHAPYPLATAPHGAWESNALMPTVQSLVQWVTRETREGGVMTAKKPTGLDPWLTPAQMIAELGISKRTWARMRAARTAPKCVRMPGGLKCRRSWFDAWLAEREANAA